MFAPLTVGPTNGATRHFFEISRGAGVAAKAADYFADRRKDSAW